MFLMISNPITIMIAVIYNTEKHNARNEGNRQKIPEITVRVRKTLL